MSDDLGRWLLDFLARDLSALRPGEWLDLTFDVQQYLLRPNVELDADQTVAGVGFANLDPAHIQSLQSMLRNGLARLDADQVWQPFETTDAPRWTLRRDKDAVERRYQGTVTTMSLAAAIDVLVAIWPSVRRCARPECGRYFLPDHGRQKFHNEECARRSRWAKFKPTRNHKAELIRRYEREKTLKHRAKKRSGR